MKKILSALFLLLFLSCSQRKTAERALTIDSEIENFFTDYNKAWSEGDVTYIKQYIYAAPLRIYSGTKTILLKNDSEVEQFLKETFKILENQNYGYSKRNKWESYRKDVNNLIIIEQNFTRYLKDGSVMGKNERKASYILMKKPEGYRIVALIAHGSVTDKK